MHPHPSPSHRATYQISAAFLSSYTVHVAKVLYRLVEGVLGGGGVNCCAAFRKMMCCGYECLIDRLGCSPSISVLSLLPFSPHHVFSLLVSAAPVRPGPSGRSGDGGLSAELEQEAGAPNLPDGVLEKKGRHLAVLYVCVSIKGVHFELTLTA